MKSSRIIVFLIFVFVISFSKASLIRSSAADELESYSNLSWKEERHRLDNFAVFLLNNPEMKGYVAFCVGRDDSIKKRQSHINRVKKYLTKFRKVDENQIIFMDIGKCNESLTILTPRDKELPKPDYSWLKIDG